ncbi:M23 family metallopeptidase [Aeromicrobium sp. 9AM]|uniref:M23 family metallopeptidase n=1 Tax=Aeromicrobium sp. 9AM TaxID=2653126 RepID=UPI0012F41D13|nr:M23 family metallopeptidase [Aeromicrobium sp. 9AM]VXB81509.1 hypothetical protein AERO9AM_20971 [Aeromicrobium sp. 9AM]
MVRPIGSSVGVSFAYGRRYSNGIIHKGVDFSDGREGHEVRSCLDGTVTHAGYGGWGPAYGQHVIVKSTFKGKTKWVLYGHLKTENVSVGQRVKAGQKLGTSGGRAGQRYSGNSTGPHLHVQVGYANRYDRYEDPWAVINYSTPVAIPVPPRPTSKPDLWFGIDLRNLAGFNDHGIDTWHARIVKTIADIKTVGRAVVAVIELPNGKVDDFKKRMSAIGYKHAGGNMGRHLFVLKHVAVDAGVVFNLSPDLGGDNKVAFMAVIRPTDNPNPAIVAVTQLENEDLTGTTQVKQARSFLSQVLAYARAKDVPEDRVFPVLDTNSDSRVLHEAFEPAGFFDTAATAYSSENSAWRTFVGWFAKPTKGKRIDLILAQRKRPVARFRVRTTTADLSDHLDIFADIGKR